ncbi:MAG: DoxX family protein [Planctomycetota bacterium]
MLIVISAVSFLAHGLGCLFSSYLKQEFERYELTSQRIWVGVLQISAGVGLLAGIRLPWLGRSAAAGLAVMMLVAVGVRYKIKDSLLQTMPALFYVVLNAYLCWAGY